MGLAASECKGALVRGPCTAVEAGTAFAAAADGVMATLTSLGSRLGCRVVAPAMVMAVAANTMGARLRKLRRGSDPDRGQRCGAGCTSRSSV